VRTEADAVDDLGEEEAIASGFGKTYNKAYLLQNLNVSDGQPVTATAVALGGNYAVRSSVRDLKGTILHWLPDYTAFYIATHAGPGCFGDCLAGAVNGEPTDPLCAYLDPWGAPTIASRVMAKYGRPESPPPYDFVWIDGCRPARDDTLASAFGIGPDSVDAAFLGYVEFLLIRQATQSWKEAFRRYLSEGDAVIDSVNKAYKEGRIPRGSIRWKGGPTVDAIATVYGDPATTLGQYVYLGTGAWYR
jgi:hypothetical protein